MTATDASTAAANAEVQQIVVYGLDPRGWNFFARVSGAAQRGIRGHETPAVIDRTVDGYWHGPTRGPQRFVGMANVGSGSAVLSEKSAEIGDVRSSDNPAQKLFADRAARRRS